MKDSALRGTKVLKASGLHWVPFSLLKKELKRKLETAFLIISLPLREP
jgi:hypothetical protein